MSRILYINTCDDCCFFDNQYYGYNETCRRLERKISGSYDDHPIPDDCPLPDEDEKEVMTPPAG